MQPNAPRRLTLDATIDHSLIADGTPMAVLVGADGRVASPVVAGADDILALAQNGHG